MRLAGLLSSAGLLATATVASANPADLDPSFGTGGIATIELGLSSGQYGFQTNDLAIDGDGRILAAGTGEWSVLARLEPDGDPDASFGNQGVVLARGWPQDVEPAPDGKIVVAAEPLVERFNADGSRDDGTSSDATPDDSFGNGGAVELGNRVATGVVVGGDGGLVVAGTINSEPDFNKIFLRSMQADGSSDPAFGTDGEAVLTVGSPGQSVWLRGLAREANGRLVVAADVRGATTGPSYGVLLRVDPTGALDPTWGTGGRVEVPALSLRGLAVNTAGIFATGDRRAPETVDSLGMRFTVSGAADPSFGIDGMLETSPSEFSQVMSVALESGGRIVLGGDAGTMQTEPAILRFTARGLRDSSFGVCGLATFPLARPRWWVGAIAVQTDGKIVFGLGPEQVPDSAARIVVGRAIGGDGTGEATPVVETGAADFTDDATTNLVWAVSLSGHIDGAGATVRWQFEFGTDQTYGYVLGGGTAGPGASNVGLTADFPFRRGVTYHYRLVAVTDTCERSVRGEDRTFMVPPAKPKEPTATVLPTPPASAVIPSRGETVSTPADEPPLQLQAAGGDARPSGSLRLKHTKLAAALKSGITLVVQASEPVKVDARARATLMPKHKPVLVASGKTVFRSAGTKALRLHFTTLAKKHLRTARRVVLAVTVVLTDAATQRTTLTKRFVVLR